MRTPAVDEVIYVRCVVTRVLPAFGAGDPPTLVVRPLSESNLLGHFNIGTVTGCMVALHSVVLPKQLTKVQADGGGSEGVKLNQKQAALLRRVVAAGRISWGDIPGTESNTMRALRRRRLIDYLHDKEPYTGDGAKPGDTTAVPGSFRWEPTEAGRKWVAENPA